MQYKYNSYGHVLVLALLIFITSACKKDGFLNVDPKGSLTDESTFATEANADLFVNDIYDQLPDMNNESQLLDQWTDNSCVGATWMTGQSLIRSNALNPSNAPDGPGAMFKWSENYSRIRRCNVFLQQAAKYRDHFSDEWYQQRVAEVKFLRALFYSFLYQNYGGVPLISEPLNNQTMGDKIFIPRASMEETLAFIEADCDAAAADLPTKAAATGRATKGAALTLKGAVDLFAASILVNTNNDPARWAKAAAANKAVIDLNVYDLFPDYNGQFLAANNWNIETIFARGYAVPSKGHRREGMQGPVIVHGVQQAWGNLEPTQNLVDDYEMANGLPITDPASGYDPQQPYVNREPRFYATIVYDGSTWQGYTFLSRVGGNNQIDLGSSSDISNTGYNGKKTLDESILGQTSLGIYPGTSNYIFYRYAEVLLNYAEAQNEATGPDASVYSAINSVRRRAGLPALPAGMTQTEMRINIRRERRIELAFEDKRWYDIRRWDITTKGEAVLTHPQYGMKITTEANGRLTYTKVPIFNSTFSQHMNWLPIPQSAMEQNTRLTPNAGY
ncbi:RagB/SusD family nutrient uptake outer membrane protein [Chitinophaga pinensis]|uniref:RagB/SusD domain protein n=1 Tax=Chitinophaga pinensis (strain ATCC 43595 / DSM 2588 / LMG 13176 / NBRC 15968 / NCIMB 11800 / UQM 2034) TaxID=485918 RepID=A0A979GTZ8_CHIPD|nr:RagB/SusD family nutrient uptake outer membrane protein [Chitinophaga pinensis]ACU60201.1 RagB/SusD domain protein [Chitinophaga pinensis DSM 2588]